MSLDGRVEAFAEVSCLRRQLSKKGGAKGGMDQAVELRVREHIVAVCLHFLDEGPEEALGQCTKLLNAHCHHPTSGGLESENRKNTKIM